MKEESELKTAEQLIIIERNRQVLKEGWTFEHDDQHINGELAKAADCYYEYAEDNDYADKKIHQYWPWEPEWWKPKNQLHDYIKAGALYKAELHRLERTGGAVGPKLTNLRIGIRQCEIRIEEILSHEAYCAKKDRPTPVVPAKTAEEILRETFEKYNNDPNSKLGIIEIEVEAMEAYHAQFTPSAKSVEIEEDEWINPDQQLNGADFLIEVNKILKTYPNTSSIKIVKLYMRQQQKQAETISRLSGDMEWIAKFCNDPECKRLAKEALSLHK